MNTFYFGNILLFRISRYKPPLLFPLSLALLYTTIFSSLSYAIVFFYYDIYEYITTSKRGASHGYCLFSERNCVDLSWEFLDGRMNLERNSVIFFCEGERLPWTSRIPRETQFSSTSCPCPSLNKQHSEILCICTKSRYNPDTCRPLVSTSIHSKGRFLYLSRVGNAYGSSMYNTVRSRVQGHLRLNIYHHTQLPPPPTAPGVAKKKKDNDSAWIRLGRYLGQATAGEGGDRGVELGRWTTKSTQCVYRVREIPTYPNLQVIQGPYDTISSEPPSKTEARHGERFEKKKKTSC